MIEKIKGQTQFMYPPPKKKQKHVFDKNYCQCFYENTDLFIESPFCSLLDLYCALMVVI